jgi:hypothetical protein
MGSPNLDGDAMGGRRDGSLASKLGNPHPSNAKRQSMADRIAEYRHYWWGDRRDLAIISDLRYDLSHRHRRWIAQAPRAPR